MLDLPPEVRLHILSFLVVYRDPVPLSQVVSRDCSILRTCHLLRREGMMVFYQANELVFGKPTSEGLLLVRYQLGLQGVESAWIRRMVLEYHRVGLSRITRLRDRSPLAVAERLEAVINGAFLSLAEVEVIDVICTAFQSFPALEAITLRFSMSCPCVRHRSTRQEVNCLISRAEHCHLLASHVKQYCQRLKKSVSIHGAPADNGAGHPSVVVQIES